MCSSSSSESPSASDRTPEDLVASLDWGAAGTGPVRLTRVVRDAANMFVAEVRDARDRALFLKQYRPAAGEPRPPEESARIEVDTLRTLARDLPRGYAVPAVVLHDEDAAIVVLEEAQGRPLDAIVREARNARRIEDAAPAVMAAGRWLRAMQRITAVPDGAATVANELLATARADRRIASLHDRAIAGAARAIGRAIAMLPQRDLTGHHGDFWPGNVFPGDGTVTVIDFEGFRSGFPLEDVAYFLIHLEMYFRFPLMRPQYDGLERAFLSGYRGEETLDEHELRTMVVIKGLQTLARGGAVKTRSLQSWLVHRVVRNRVLRSLHD